MFPSFAFYINEDKQSLTALPLNECVLEVKSESIIRVFPNSADTFSHFLIKLVNNGPSGISQTVLELRCPLSTQGQTVLYPLEFSTQGPINCTSDSNMNHLGLKVSLHTASLAWVNGDCCIL